MTISENKMEHIINERKIMWFSFALLVALFSLMYLPVTLLWGWNYTFSGLNLLLKHLILWLIPIVVLHEGLHGFIWAITLKDGYRQIKFGFNKEMLAPYTNCKVPLNKWIYIAGGVAPLVIMGIIPASLSFCFNSSYWYCFSLFCIWSSAGDIISCFYLLKVPKGFKILDHPEKLGFILVPI
jgi:hypothetical protein